MLSKHKKKRRLHVKSRHLATLDNPKSPIAESFRTLRTNIQFADVENGLKVIMVASAGPEEGKTTTLGNLAVTLSHAGEKVLVIDCDMRKPVLHHVFFVENDKGLTNALMGKVSLEEAVQSTMVENLFVLPCGTVPPNPSELLSSKRFRETLEDLKGGFDRILIDTPPINIVTDGVILSQLADGVIIVALAEKTKTYQAKYMQEQLESAGARVLGVVLNQVPQRKKDYHYYRYYQQEE